MAKYRTKDPRRQKYTTKASAAMRFVDPVNPDDKLFYKWQEDYKPRVLAVVLAGLDKLSGGDLQKVIDRCRELLDDKKKAA